MYNTEVTIAEYLEKLPMDRRTAIAEVRKVIRKNLPTGYQEVIQYDMITYVVPLSVYSAGYLGNKEVPLPYLSLGNQKNHMSLYLTCISTNKKAQDWFVHAYKKTGKKPDMGKSCVRFKALADLPLDVIGKAVKIATVEEFIVAYEKTRK